MLHPIHFTINYFTPVFAIVILIWPLLAHMFKVMDMRENYFALIYYSAVATLGGLILLVYALVKIVKWKREMENARVVP